MAIKLNDLLHLTGEQIANSRIELNMTAGRYGEAFISRWLELPAKAKESGISNCSYWGWYSKNQRNFYPGDWVFSFAQMSYDEWLFMSAAEIVDVPKNSHAHVKILTQYQNLFGRLIIKHNKGNTFSRWVFKLSSRIDSCNVKEILPCIYSGEKFEGYDNVYLPFHKLLITFLIAYLQKEKML